MHIRTVHLILLPSRLGFNPRWAADGSVRLPIFKETMATIETILDSMYDTKIWDIERQSDIDYYTAAKNY